VFARARPAFSGMQYIVCLMNTAISGVGGTGKPVPYELLQLNLYLDCNMWIAMHGLFYDERRVIV
jgi:hypothetical protein